MKKLLTLLPLTLFGLASISSAQAVSFLGKVEDVSGVPGQFVVDCSSTQLTSAVFDLNVLVGQMSHIEGQWNGSFLSPAVTVTDIVPALETFEIGGGAKIGDDSSLAFTGTPGDTAIGVLSVGNGFIPFQGGDGVIFVNLPQAVLSRTGTIGVTGIVELSFSIPNDPALVGLDVFAQGVTFAPSGAATLTNPDCKTISD